MGDIRLVVLGGMGVGKSAITVQYIQNIFVERYDPSIEDSYRKMVSLDNINSAVEILDTAGTNDLLPIRELSLQNGDGFLLIFSLTNRESFDLIATFYNQIKYVKLKNNFPLPPIVLVGNKCDLNKKRQISMGDIEEFCEYIDNCEYFEVSAKDRINIDEIFEYIIREIRNNTFVEFQEQNVYK